MLDSIYPSPMEMSEWNYRQSEKSLQHLHMGENYKISLYPFNKILICNKCCSSCIFSFFFIIFYQLLYLDIRNCICGVMVLGRSPRVRYRGFEPGRVKSRTLKLVFSVSPHILAEREHRLVGPNHDNVAKWSNLSTLGLLFQWTCAIKI